MTITPDTKDWTWVLEKACSECGFDSTATQPTDVAALLRANVAQWVQILASPEQLVRTRPAPAVWSPLEYACHVRDVFRKFDERLTFMLEEDNPTFANWDQDATAVEHKYGEQNPATVSNDLARAGEKLAAGFEGVTPQQWERRGRRSDGANFTIATFSRYLIHDPIHHVHDATGKRYADQS
ncbi:MAG: DinB family protein [Actinomycetota bacterium]